MDEYHRTGPKSSKAAANDRERAARDRMRNLLSLATEQEFREALSKDFQIEAQDSRFTRLTQLWREQH